MRRQKIEDRGQNFLTSYLTIICGTAQADCVKMPNKNALFFKHNYKILNFEYKQQIFLKNF
jgi:hypothetical protein